MVVINGMLVLLARQVIADLLKKNYQNIRFVPKIYIITQNVCSLQ
jgi:hypothetical protein